MLKFATVKVTSSVLVPTDASPAQLQALAHKHHFDFTPRPGYLYVRSRAISSRTNDNFDEFPADEIKQAYRTFIGKPVFVNHNNDNHKRARGVCIDAALHEDRLADGSPDTWVEALMEVDAVRFPKLAEAIRTGRIDRTSMGCDVAYSLCSMCGNKATTPAEYCNHIPRLKGKKVLKRNASTGAQEEHLIRETCYGLKFFENSLLVEEPADPTAYFTGVDDHSGLGKAAAKEYYPTGWFPASDECEQDPNNDGYCTEHEAYHDQISDEHLRHTTSAKTADYEGWSYHRKHPGTRLVHTPGHPIIGPRKTLDVGDRLLSEDGQVHTITATTPRMLQLDTHRGPVHRAPIEGDHSGSIWASEVYDEAGQDVPPMTDAQRAYLDANPKGPTKYSSFSEDWAKVPTDPLDNSQCVSRKDNPTFCLWHKTEHLEPNGEPRGDIDGHGNPVEFTEPPRCDLCNGFHDSLHHYDAEMQNDHHEDESALDGLDDDGHDGPIHPGDKHFGLLQHFAALERDDPDAVHLESHPGHPETPTLCNRRGPQYKTHADVTQATCEDCLREHEGGQECDHPYCQENDFPEGWHTRAEHIDPSHLDEGHPDYQDAEKAVRDALGDHPLGFLLDQNHRDDGTNGPSKYSLLQTFAGMHGVPLHEPGDRVISGKGESGTVIYVQDSGHPGKSNKVGVEVDGTENPPEGHPDHVAWQKPGEKMQMHNYEQVWSPHPDAPPEQHARYHQRKADNKAATDLLSSIESADPNTEWAFRQHEGAYDDRGAHWDDNPVHHEDYNTKQGCETCGDSSHNTHEHDAVQDGWSQYRREGYPLSETECEAPAYGPHGNPALGHGPWNNEGRCMSCGYSAFDYHNLSEKERADSLLADAFGGEYPEHGDWLLGQQHEGPSKYSSVIPGAMHWCNDCGRIEGLKERWDEHTRCPSCGGRNLGNRHDPTPSWDEQVSAHHGLEDEINQIGGEHSWLLGLQPTGPTKYSLLQHFAVEKSHREFNDPENPNNHPHVGDDPDGCGRCGWEASAHPHLFQTTDGLIRDCPVCAHDHYRRDPYHPIHDSGRYEVLQRNQGGKPHYRAPKSLFGSDPIPDDLQEQMKGLVGEDASWLLGQQGEGPTKYSLLQAFASWDDDDDWDEDEDEGPREDDSSISYEVSGVHGTANGKPLGRYSPETGRQTHDLGSTDDALHMILHQHHDDGEDSPIWMHGEHGPTTRQIDYEKEVQPHVEEHLPNYMGEGKPYGKTPEHPPIDEYSTADAIRKHLVEHHDQDPRDLRMTQHVKPGEEGHSGKPSLDDLIQQGVGEGVPHAEIKPTKGENRVVPADRQYLLDHHEYLHDQPCPAGDEGCHYPSGHTHAQRDTSHLFDPGHFGDEGKRDWANFMLSDPEHEGPTKYSVLLQAFAGMDDLNYSVPEQTDDNWERSRILRRHLINHHGYSSQDIEDTIDRLQKKPGANAAEQGSMMGQIKDLSSAFERVNLVHRIHEHEHGGDLRSPAGHHRGDDSLPLHDHSHPDDPLRVEVRDPHWWDYEGDPHNHGSGKSPVLLQHPHDPEGMNYYRSTEYAPKNHEQSFARDWLHPDRTDAQPNRLTDLHEDDLDWDNDEHAYAKRTREELDSYAGGGDLDRLDTCPHTYPNNHEARTFPDEGERSKCQTCGNEIALHATTRPSEIGKPTKEFYERRGKEFFNREMGDFKPLKQSLNSGFGKGNADQHVTCDQGHRHWGAAGAAGLLIRHTDDQGTRRYLLQHRSPWVDQPDTWGIPGGALHHGESPEDGAIRESHEELGGVPHGMTHAHTHADDHGGWAFHTVVMDSPSRWGSSGGDDADHETGEGGTQWYTPEEMKDLDLHPGFAKTWRSHLSKMAAAMDHCMHCNRPITQVNPGEPVEWQHDSSAGGAGVPHRAEPGGTPRPETDGETAKGGAGAPGGAEACPGGVCGITGAHRHVKQAGVEDEPCPECGKPNDHIHIDQRSMDVYKAIADAAQTAAEMHQHHHQRVVDLSDHADLKSHLLTAHDLDDGDFWRNSHDDDHPALGPSGDEDRPLTHKEIRDLHLHDHRDPDWGMPGQFMGESHFHTASREPVEPAERPLSWQQQDANLGQMMEHLQARHGFSDEVGVIAGMADAGHPIHGDLDVVHRSLHHFHAGLHEGDVSRSAGDGHSHDVATDPLLSTEFPLEWHRRYVTPSNRVRHPHQEKDFDQLEFGEHTPLRQSVNRKTAATDDEEWEAEKRQPCHLCDDGAGHPQPHTLGEHFDLNEAKGLDAWGRPLHRPYDGHGAWDCNNFNCTEHPQRMYEQGVGMPGWMKHDLQSSEEKDLGREIGKHFHEQGLTEDARYLLDQQHEGPTKYSAIGDNPNKGLVRHTVPAEEIGEGDFLDIGGRVRVHNTLTRGDQVTLAWRQRGSKAPGIRRHTVGEQVHVWRRGESKEALTSNPLLPDEWHDWERGYLHGKSGQDPKDDSEAYRKGHSQGQHEYMRTASVSVLIRHFATKEKLPGDYLDEESNDGSDYWAKTDGEAPYDPVMAHHGFEEHQEGHGPWHLTRHPETRAYQVVDNQNRLVRSYSDPGNPKYELHDQNSHRRAVHDWAQVNQDHGHIPKWRTPESRTNPHQRAEPDTEVEETGLSAREHMGRGLYLPGTERAHRPGEPEEDWQRVDTQHVEFHQPAPPFEHSTEDPKIAEYKKHAEENPAPKVYPAKTVVHTQSRENGTTYRQINHGDPGYDSPGAFHDPSPSEEWHGPYRVIQHPETGKYHVADNQNRITGYGGREGVDEQHRAEYLRDYADGRQASKEKGRGLAESLWGSTMEVLDPGGTPESRRTERHGEALNSLMHRYEGGEQHPLHPGKFGWDDEDEKGDEQGAPYYEVKDPAGSGWKARDYGGAYVEIHHEATGPVDSVHVAEENNRNHDVIRSPAFGHEELHQELHNWAHGNPNPDPRYPDDIDPDTGRGHAVGKDYARNEPAIERWQQRHRYRG